MLTAVLAIVIAAVLWRIYSRYQESPLDALPGPPQWPIVGNIFTLLNMNPENILYTFGDYTKIYGDRYILKIFEKRILHISRPEDIELVLNHSRNITKSQPYEFMKPWLGTGLLLNNGSSWLKRRKMMTPTFHFNILRNFAVVMQDKSRDLVSRLRAAPPADVDVLQVISDMTLFTICETAMGTQLDTEKTTDAVKYKNAIQNISSVILDRTVKVWLHNDFLFRFSSIKNIFDEYLKTVHSFADKVIIDKKKKRSEMGEEVKASLAGEDVGTKRRLAMLDLLLEAERKGEIDLTGIRDEVNTFMFEGYDTTAMALTFCIMLLADHDDVQERIFEETTQILGDRLPTISDLPDMKYLEAVLKETMRMYPSVPFIGRYIDEDFMMGDIPIKKGTEISVHIYDTHHRADLFPEPEVFNPERFLSNDNRHPYAYVPFSAGPRNCIGQKFAMQEMKFVIAELCRNFKLVPKVKGLRPHLKGDMILRPVDPIYVKFVPRNTVK